MPLLIVRNDITKMDVDVIVNAANAALKQGGGVCGAIFSAAGEKELQTECDGIEFCDVGEAVITKGYNLPAKWIIHTVGPIWKDGKHNEESFLFNCYYNSLKLASKYDCESIAFPVISSGIFGYPKDQALKIANEAIKEFLIDHEMMVYIVVYDNETVKISESLYNEIEKYIDDKYVAKRVYKKRERKIEYEKICVKEPELTQYKVCCENSFSIEETFSEMLLRLIDERGMTDPQVYNAANIDRRLFSKIRNNKYYQPKKITAIAFTIALELNHDRALDLLKTAGYTLSHSNLFDVIVEYFIKQENYNLFEINEVLFSYEQLLLGA